MKKNKKRKELKRFLNHRNIFIIIIHHTLYINKLYITYYYVSICNVYYVCVSLLES